MKRRILCLLMICALLLSTGALAADETTYLFQTRDAITEAALLSRTECICAENRVYQTAFPAVLWELEAAGQLLNWEEDTEVSLIEVTTDAAALLSSDSWTDAMLGMDYADRNGVTGAGVRIGMIDSGVRSDFAALTGAAVAEGTNYLAAAGTAERTNTNDTYGHGTFVASILASEAVGVAPGAELIPLKCFNGVSGSISGIVSAVYDAVNVYHVDVLNMSLGISTDKYQLYQAIRYAYEAGVIIVAASGNLMTGVLSKGNDPLYYPAAYDEVIGVGAVDAQGAPAVFSFQNDSVLITAPGAGVTGLQLRGTGYASGSGTSYAAPFAAGAAALARSIDPTLTPDGFMALLAETAEDRGSPGRDRAYGSGILNVGLLLALLREDEESIIVTGCAGAQSLSAYIPKTDNGYQVMWARYDEDGRLLDTGCAAAGETRVVRNLRLQGTAAAVALMILERDTWRPLRSCIR